MDGFTPREPAQYPLALVLLIIIAILTVPWYTQGPHYSKLYLSIPLWTWIVLFWTVVLAVSIMLTAKYLWHLEPEDGGVENG